MLDYMRVINFRIIIIIIIIIPASVMFIDKCGEIVFYTHAKLLYAMKTVFFSWMLSRD